MLRPLTDRDFALLWTGMTVSFLGDGIYLVALAWQVYDISNTPTALSMVMMAWTLPMVLFLLVGGVISDRFERRRVMMFSDVVRAVALVGLGLLSVSGVLELWHMIVLVVLYGTGEAFFNPAFGAIVPELVPPELLVEANSVDQFVRPVAHRLIGPALGGLIVHRMGGPGGAFLVDGATFAMSFLFLMAMRKRSLPVPHDDDETSTLKELREGFAFVRANTWLWATLGAASISLLFFWGPEEVLVPFVVRNRLGGGPDDLGLVFASGGVGALLAAGLVAQMGMPRRHVLFMYSMWLMSVGSISGFAFVTTLWQAMLVSFIGGAGTSAGLVIWGTLMHRLVPPHLLGRVTSFDWTISTGLLPLSLALTGPVGESVGVSTTLAWAGVLGAAATAAFMLVPGLYDTERDGRLAMAGEADKELQETHA